MIRVVIGTRAAGHAVPRPAFIADGEGTQARKLQFDAARLGFKLGTIVPSTVARAFEDKRAVDLAKGRLEKRRTDPDANVSIGHNTIRRYLGNGDADRSNRAERGHEICRVPSFLTLGNRVLYGHVHPLAKAQSRLQEMVPALQFDQLARGAGRGRARRWKPDAAPYRLY